MTIGNFRLWKTARRLLVLGFVAAAALWIISGAGAGAQAPARFAESSVVARTAGGGHRFTVELAATDAQRSLGLMFRRELAADRGMLFDFGRETFISMWMRNTFIPLDMLFIASDGRITFIRENTTPHSLETIEAPERNRAVLEVAAGTVARLGIRVGDRVEHEIFR